MYKSLVENYINSMSYEKLRSYISKNYSYVSEEEIKIIYKYIKNRWRELYNEEKEVLVDLKSEVCEQTYNEIIKLLAVAYKFKNK